jgi:hypothetical protein
MSDMIRAIFLHDAQAVERLLAESPELARERVKGGATRAKATLEPEAVRELVRDGGGHYIYAGDTALHLAAAAYAAYLVSVLTRAGADVAAANRRGGQPLHYAVDGGPNRPGWDPAAQSDTIGRLLDAGADPNATDKGGSTPLHRAIRNRCAAAVAVLLERGADATLPNGRGSTPWQLANWTTGKGGSGSAAAKEQQAEILRLLATRGAATG